MKVLLAPAGVVTMEFPHLLRLIEETEFDTIYHEHFSYFSALTVERVFAAHGLRLFDVEELPTHGGSLRIYATHAEDESHDDTGRVAELVERERAAGLADLATYSHFRERVRGVRQGLREFLEAARAEGRSVAAYGAAAKGVTLLNYCGIGPELVEYVADRSPHKQGLYLPGRPAPDPLSGARGRDEARLPAAPRLEPQGRDRRADEPRPRVGRPLRDPAPGGRRP